MDEFSARLLEHLPWFITDRERDLLTRELREFPRLSYRADGAAPEIALLQGDIWTGFTATVSGRPVPVKGLILSNTCDIDANNKRHMPARIQYAAIMSLKKYESLLAELGFEHEVIVSKRNAIIDQSVSSIFAVPSEDPSEYLLAMLDDIHQMELDKFDLERNSRLARLSESGFYVLLMKISFHFTRVAETISRR